MSAQSWFKFYPSDWRADPALRMCSLAARGLWIELISLMHEAEPYGHLVVGGVEPTPAQIGALVGSPARQITLLLGELEAAGVFSRTEDGTVYSRKMVRAEAASRAGRENGKRGGNPNLKPHGGLTPPDNPGPNRQVNGAANTQKPDTRNQIPEGKKEPSPPPATTAVRAPDVDVGADDQTERERVLVAMGHDPTGLTATGRLVGGQSDMLEFGRWRTDLGLTVEQILAVVAEVAAAKRDGPAGSFRYFTEAMRRRAGELRRDPLAPAAPQPGAKPTAAERYRRIGARYGDAA